jgi:hypothetical protein
MAVNSVSGNSGNAFDKVDNKSTEKEVDKRRTKEEEQKKRQEDLLNPVDKAVLTQTKSVGAEIAKSLL